MNLRNPAVALVTAVLYSCTSQTASLEHMVHRIAATTSYPLTNNAVVKIISDYGGDRAHSTICSGSLIDSVHVLTAAHCLMHDNLVQRTIELLDGRIVMVAESIWVTPFCGTTDCAGSDIGLITLEHPLMDIEPLDLALLPPKPGDSVVIAGYGQRDFGGDPGVGHWGVDTIAIVGDTGIILSSTGATGLGGDSGGPVLIDGRIYGVISWVALDNSNGAARTDIRVGWLIAHGIRAPLPDIKSPHALPAQQ